MKEDEVSNLLILSSFGFVVLFEALRIYPSQLYVCLWNALWFNSSFLPILTVFVFFTPLLFMRRRMLDALSFRFLTAVLFVSFFLLSLNLPPEVSIFISAAVIFVFPPFLREILRHFWFFSGESESFGEFISFSFLIAFLFDFAFRIAYLTLDVRLLPRFAPFALFIVLFLASMLEFPEEIYEEKSYGSVDSEENSFGLFWLGASLVILLSLNLFSNPNTVLRWGLIDYPIGLFFSLVYVCSLVISLVLISLHYLRIDVFGKSLGFDYVFIFVFMTFSLVYLGGFISIAFSFLFPIVFPMLMFFFLSRLGGKDIYRFFTIFYISYITFSFIYAFTFIYPYLPGLNIFRDRAGELFSITSLIVLFIALIYLIRSDKIIRPKLGNIQFNKKTFLGLIFIPLLATSFIPIIYGGTGPTAEYHLSFNVMSYNIHQGYSIENKLDIENIYDTIRKENLDIVGLQETDTGRLTSQYVDELLWLSNRLKMFCVFGPALGKTYGVAILSKFPIIEHKYYLLPSKLEQRVLLYAKIDLGYTKINFFTIHLGLTKEERINQLEYALEIIDGYQGYKVLTGDFNSHPDSEEIGMVKEKLYDARDLAISRSGGEGTYPSDKPTERIDYIFVSNNFTVSRFKTVKSLASDHLPILAELKLNPGYTLKGSLYANDSGQPKGGFEWAGEYNITLKIFPNGTGYMLVIFNIGLGDPLKVHFYLISNFTKTNETLTFLLRPPTISTWFNITCIYTENDTTWNRFHGYYIGSYLNPEAFPGFGSNYYVEIRIPRS
ncbi:MAG: endonuclease/exonuclease/phosphatase family protein [Candidatus Njordarchaeia archaeon]